MLTKLYHNGPIWHTLCLLSWWAESCRGQSIEVERVMDRDERSRNMEEMRESLRKIKERLGTKGQPPAMLERGRAGCTLGERADPL